MATVSKTAGTSLAAWQDVATANVIVGTALDVSTKLAATVFAFLGRNSSSAFTAGWPNIRIEGSAKASGNDAWVPLATFQPVIGASIAATTLNGAVSANASSFVVTSATNIAAGDMMFLGHTSDTTKYELVRVKSVSGTTITPEENVTNAHDTGAVASDQAEAYAASLDLTGITRIRAVIDNAGSGRTIYVQVLCVTGDSIG